MKKIILTIVLLGTLANAGCNTNSGDCKNGNKNNAYKDSDGNSYQYDLNDQMDALEYSTDGRAQMRDSLDRNPTKGMFKFMGENYGGKL